MQVCDDWGVRRGEPERWVLSGDVRTNRRREQWSPTRQDSTQSYAEEEMSNEIV